MDDVQRVCKVITDNDLQEIDAALKAIEPAHTLLATYAEMLESTKAIQKQNIALPMHSSMHILNRVDKLAETVVNLYTLRRELLYLRAKITELRKLVPPQKGVYTPQELQEVATDLSKAGYADGDPVEKIDESISHGKSAADAISRARRILKRQGVSVEQLVKGNDQGQRRVPTEHDDEYNGGV